MSAASCLHPNVICATFSGKEVGIRNGRSWVQPQALPTWPHTKRFTPSLALAVGTGRKRCVKGGVNLFFYIIMTRVQSGKKHIPLRCPWQEEGLVVTSSPTHHE